MPRKHKRKFCPELSTLTVILAVLSELLRKILVLVINRLMNNLFYSPLWPTTRFATATYRENYKKLSSTKSKANLLILFEYFIWRRHLYISVGHYLNRCQMIERTFISRSIKLFIGIKKYWRVWRVHWFLQFRLRGGVLLRHCDVIYFHFFKFVSSLLTLTFCE